MRIDGGATEGYWAIGSLTMATPPSTRMNSAITQAKTGRSMKNLAILRLLRLGSGRCGSGCRHRCAAGRPGHRLDRRVRAHLLETVDDHLLACLQAVHD